MKNTVAFALGVAVGYKAVPIVVHLVYLLVIGVLIAMIAGHGSI